MTNSVINVQNVTKVYKLFNKPSDRLKEALSPVGKCYHKDFRVLNNVSFSISKGEMVGIIGKNGSGKSTLLKIITGLLKPSSGNIKVIGNVSALLELGAGFNPEYTGIENIYLNGTIMGYSKEEMDNKLEGIIEFADIGDFVNQPVKMYSSGMFVRLAFAVAINVDPEILIIDEALSVGDMRFQQKCFRKIEEFKRNKTVLFVSHDLTVINKYCSRAIWINEGEVMEDSTPEVVSKTYQAFMLGSQLSKSTLGQVLKTKDEERSSHIMPISEKLDVLGDNKARITGINLLDQLTGETVSIVKPGQYVQLVIQALAIENIENPIAGFSLKDRLGNIITQSNSYVLEKRMEPLIAGREYLFGFQFAFPPLSRGEYSISPAVASGSLEDHVQHSWVHDALIVQMLDNAKYQLSGIMSLEDAIFYQLE